MTYLKIKSGHYLDQRWEAEEQVKLASLCYPVVLTRQLLKTL